MQACLTLGDVLIPRKTLLSDILLVLGASLFMALMARIALPLPFSPVPVTGQTFAVLLVGAVLGSRLGTLGVLAYIAEGAAGMPVFAGGGGFAYLLGPTGGRPAEASPGYGCVAACVEGPSQGELSRFSASVHFPQ